MTCSLHQSVSHAGKPGLDPILAPVATGAKDKGGSDDTEMTENRISLSVVIPFYKDEVYVEDAVVSALSQPIPDLEVIVVNDNPGPESGAFLAAMQERHEFRVVTHEVNRGLSAARNTGIEAARGITSPLLTLMISSSPARWRKT